MKKNKFQGLSHEEASHVVQVEERDKKKHKTKALKKFTAPEVCYTSDPEQHFTTCFLKPIGKSKKIFIGNSKRATYAKMYDEPNQHVGKIIALTRAVKNYIQNANFIEI